MNQQIILPIINIAFRQFFTLSYLHDDSFLQSSKAFIS